MGRNVGENQWCGRVNGGGRFRTKYFYKRRLILGRCDNLLHRGMVVWFGMMLLLLLEVHTQRTWMNVCLSVILFLGHIACPLSIEIDGWPQLHLQYAVYGMVVMQGCTYSRVYEEHRFLSRDEFLHVIKQTIYTFVA
jgi:hypothetical protein